MNKYVRPLLALALATFCGAGAHALDASGYANDSLSTLINHDSFNLSVRKRMESLRIGSVGQSFGSLRSAGLFSSDEAYALAPSSRTGSYASARRRQLDCVYYSGVTIWADLYQTWARQRARGADDGYKHKVFGPAIGLDWTSGPFSIGIAGTYNWGKMRGINERNDRRTKQWGAEIYGQYNADLFYVNATIGYGHNTIRSRRNDFSTGFPLPGTGSREYGDKYSTNAVNLDAEFGWKFNWSGLQVVPHAGIRYFHDRRGNIDEGRIGTNLAVQANSENYDVLEVPLGIDVGYEINTGGAIIVPRAKFGYALELARDRNEWSGTHGSFASTETGARRSRNGFSAGLGIEAKFTKNLSAHVDYTAKFRSSQYEHHWNLGMGFSF